MVESTLSGLMTWSEYDRLRISIVEYCIENNTEWPKAAEAILKINKAEEKTEEWYFHSFK